MQAHDPASDAVLIARFLGGEAAAFESLINPHRQRLYSYLCRMIDDSESAKDLLQEVLVKVLQALPQYREQKKFSSWLFSTTPYGAQRQNRILKDSELQRKHLNRGDAESAEF